MLLISFFCIQNNQSQSTPTTKPSELVDLEPEKKLDKKEFFVANIPIFLAFFITILLILKQIFSSIQENIKRRILFTQKQKIIEDNAKFFQGTKEIMKEIYNSIENNKKSLDETSLDDMAISFLNFISDENIKKRDKLKSPEGVFLEGYKNKGGQVVFDSSNECFNTNYNSNKKIQYYLIHCLLNINKENRKMTNYIQTIEKTKISVTESEYEYNYVNHVVIFSDFEVSRVTYTCESVFTFLYLCFCSKFYNCKKNISCKECCTASNCIFNSEGYIIHGKQKSFVADFLTICICTHIIDKQEISVNHSDFITSFFETLQKNDSNIDGTIFNSSINEKAKELVDIMIKDYGMLEEVKLEV